MFRFLQGIITGMALLFMGNKIVNGKKVLQSSPKNTSDNTEKPEEKPEEKPDSKESETRTKMDQVELLLGKYEKETGKRFFFIGGVMDDSTVWKLEMYIRSLLDIPVDLKTIELNIIMITLGGTSTSMALLIKQLQLFKKINTYIFRYAESAGTFLALCSDNIYMDNLSHMTAADCMLKAHTSEFCAISDVIEFVEKKSDQKQINLSDHLLYKDAKRYRYLEKSLEKYLKHDSEKVRENILYPSFALHTTPYMKEELKSFGVKIQDIPPDFYKLYKELEFIVD